MVSTTNCETETTALVRNVLSTKFGHQVTNVELDPRSNNTRVYIVTLAQAGGDDVSAAAATAVAQQPGTDVLPAETTRVIMRLTNADACLNNAVRVQNEVAARALARNALGDEKVVPRVYGWYATQPATDTEPEQAGWILEELMPGQQLGRSEFNKLGRDSQRTVLDHIARLFYLIQSYQLPDSVQGYGGLNFAPDGSIVTGPTAIHGARKSCATYHELYTEYLQTQLSFMDKCDLVKGWKKYGDLRARLENFVARGFQKLLANEVQEKPRQVLIHGDFDLHNLLFDPETLKITGLLDFEFSHVAAAADEYFYSFAVLGGLVVPPMDTIEQDYLRVCLLYGFGDDPQEMPGGPNSHMDWEAIMMRDEAFFTASVLRPIDLMPAIEPLSDIYWFIQNVSPPMFFFPKCRAKSGPARFAKILEETQAQLSKSLAAWGY